MLLFLLAIPAVYTTDYDQISPIRITLVNYTAAILSVLGALLRAYTIGTTPRGTSGRNTREQVAESLNTSGIYSVVRHPLYLGNYLMWIGIVFFTQNFNFVIIVSLLYWIYYERIMFAEERFLERKFGNAYLEWSKKAPAFFPRVSQFRKSETSFSLRSVLRREYSGILATVFGFLYVEFLIGWFRWNTIAIGKNLIWFFIVILLITIILRTVKHNTKLLNEEGRS